MVHMQRRVEASQKQAAEQKQCETPSSSSYSNTSPGKHILILAEENNTERKSGDSGREREREAKIGKTDLKKKKRASTAIVVVAGISWRVLNSPGSLAYSGHDFSYITLRSILRRYLFSGFRSIDQILITSWE